MFNMFGLFIFNKWNFKYKIKCQDFEYAYLSWNLKIENDKPELRVQSPKSKPQIPKSQIQWGKGDFGLWAVSKIL